jgi:hypothetical protein
MILDSESGGGLRMGQTSISKSAVIKTIDEAAGLSREARCRLFEEVFRLEENWTLEGYETMGREGCSGIPLHGADSQIR